MICAERHLPWTQDDFDARAGLFEPGGPDYRQTGPVHRLPAMLPGIGVVGEHGPVSQLTGPLRPPAQAEEIPPASDPDEDPGARAETLARKVKELRGALHDAERAAAALASKSSCVQGRCRSAQIITMAVRQFKFASASFSRSSSR